MAALYTITHHHGPIRFTYHSNGGGDNDSYMSASLFILTVLSRQSVKGRWPGGCARTVYTQVVTFHLILVCTTSLLRSRSQAAFSYPEALVWISPPPNQPKNALVSVDHIHLVFQESLYRLVRKISEITYALISLLSEFLVKVSSEECLKHQTRWKARVKNSLKLFFHLAIEP